ncbi:MAG: hypothetical protein FWB80_14970 [Defluviitaleaceae bacterium]|nr:hypothetical protein [Defluviitaleaceae bacterium]
MILFLSEGRINILQESTTRALECEIAEKYKERTRELRRKNEWKNSGSGATFMGSSMFTGVFMGNPDMDMKLPITGVSRHGERLIYALNTESSGGMYFTSPDTDEQDTHVYVNAVARFFELDVNDAGIVAVSCSDGNYFERHISLFDIEKNNFHNLTDGECSDCNPHWSRKDKNVLLYDSAGIGRDGHGNFAAFGPRSIYRLNTKTGDLDEILSGEKFEYTNPFEDADGSLYFIRRMYKPVGETMSLKDIILAPFRVLRAIGSWFNFFSIRYTGEPLNTAGANPAKTAQKSQQQIFIDGNLIESEKNMRLNAAAGDKYAGYAPRHWELVVKSPDGQEKILQKSVMGYCITDGDVVYSNGKYIITKNGATKVHLASKLKTP